MPQSLKIGSLRAPLSERGLDCYDTPEVAVHALLRVEFIPRVVWEPACGAGNIVNVLRERGHRVYASDLYNRGCSEADSDVDFLKEIQAPHGVEAIVTNPPFKIANSFVAHALDLGVPKICMLLRLAFCEGGYPNGYRGLRSKVMDGGKLARIHVFRKRLPMMHRLGWEGRKANSGMPFAWFCWEAEHQGPTELHRISWEAIR